ADAHRSNLFVVALDDRGHWFRYHHLLRDLLRRELARRHPGLLADLHARAFAWYEANGEIDAAITHALAAGHVQEAGELLPAHWNTHWHANPSAVIRWFEALPPGAVETDARLCLVRAWTQLFLGRPEEVEPLVATAEALPVRPGDDCGTFES